MIFYSVDSLEMYFFIQKVYRYLYSLVYLVK